MQIKTFCIPALSPERSEGDANAFLRSHRILRVERNFAPNDGGYWAILVEYADTDPDQESPPASRREKKDYSKVLNADEYARYELYRERRKQLATERSVPAYMIFTNEELAILSHLPVLNAETVKRVKCIAPSRLSDYAAEFFDLLPETELT